MVTPAPAGAEQFDVIRLAFDAVGVTPNDTYILYIDGIDKARSAEIKGSIRGLL